MLEFLSHSKLTITVGLFFAFIFIKVIFGHLLKKKPNDEGVDRRYLFSNIKNALNLFLMLSLVFLWSQELQRFALSIAAFVVAIVLATKEIIQCFIGFIYLSTSAPFRIGDWIQVNDTCGEVAEIDWAKVTLLEVDLNTYSYTGKTTYLPNSSLMLQYVKNLNFMRRYVNHAFDIIREHNDVMPIELISALEKKAASYCSGFKDVAERYNSLIETRLDVKIAGPEPSVKVSTTELGKIKVSFSLFCPTEDAMDIEQRLITDFFYIWNQCLQKQSGDS